MREKGKSEDQDDRDDQELIENMELLQALDLLQEGAQEGGHLEMIKDMDLFVQQDKIESDKKDKAND